MSDNYFEEEKISDTDKIRKNPCYYISRVEHTYENCLLAVSLYYEALRYIPKMFHTNEMCLIAIKQCGYAIKYVSKKIITEELCLEAIKYGNIDRFGSEWFCGRYDIFECIPEKYITLDFCIKAYTINPNLNWYFSSFEFDKVFCEYLDRHDTSNQNEQDIPLIEQVKKDGLNLGKIESRKKSKHMCMTAVENNSLALRYVPNRFKTQEICNLAVEDNPMTLEYVPEEFKTQEICSLAVEDNPMTLEYVPEEFKTLEICNLAIENNLIALKFVPENLLTREVIERWAENVIISLNSNEIEDEIYLRKLCHIILGFSESIVSNSKIITLQRMLEMRQFVCKKYDVEQKKFITIEKVLRYVERIEEVEEEQEFHSFEEFYKYVDFDLRNTDLYEYTFKEIDLKSVDIKDALISSEVLIKQGLYDSTYYNSIVPIDKGLLTPLPTIDNEEIDAHSLMHMDDMDDERLNDSDIKFYYISDIHLMHKIKKKFPLHATENEIAEFVKSIVGALKTSSQEMTDRDYLLIGGDISFNFEVSKLFYTELVKQFKDKSIIAILGNHELWDAQINNDENSVEYSTDGLNETIEKYRDMFKELNIYFLHNQLLVLDKETKKLRVSSEKQLLNISSTKLKEIALTSSFILFGGLGFSAYDKGYNALNGLYRNKLITLEEDLAETSKFETLYSKLKQTIPSEKVIVFTHTPKSNWSKDNYHKNWIYINGHTHKNEYTIDSEKTVYSDNQIGYKSMNFGLKYFSVSNTYNIFRYYEDGKYIIKRTEYLEFNRGIGIYCTCNRSKGVYHMLKKQNSYCFFYEENIKLYLLNGGAIKIAEYQDLDYYFENLNVYADAVKNILQGYNKALKQISKEIKKIGGRGNIHGCIIDIDFYNHIYLNPKDGTLTAYYATDIINKQIYTSPEALLRDQCLELYNNFRELSSNNTSILSLTALDDKMETGLKRYVFSTDMYEPSRLIKSLQYITENNVIRQWDDIFIDKMQNSLQKQQLVMKQDKSEK